MANFDDYTGLQLWLEADAGITVSDTDALGQHGGPLGNPSHTWNDAGAVEGTTDDIFGDTLFADAYRANPTYRTNIINSLPVVRFLESDTPLRENALFTNHRLLTDRSFIFSADTGLLSTTAFTSFALFRINSFDLDDDGWWWIWGPSGSHPWTGLQIERVSGTIKLHAYHEQSDLSIQSITWSIGLDTWYLAEVWHDGSNLAGVLNGCEPLSVASGTMYNGSTAVLEIGAQHNADFTDVSWDLAGLVLYDELRDATAREILRHVWRDKYDLTVDDCSINLTPDPLVLTLAFPTPTVIAADNLYVQPDPLVLTLTFPAPSLHTATNAARRTGSVQLLGLGV